jgi:hypothetical protein
MQMMAIGHQMQIVMITGKTILGLGGAIMQPEGITLSIVLRAFQLREQ